MTERRYNDDEVAAIFAKATASPSPDSPRTPGDDGLTLRDLQEIGREVGVAPEAVARAAQSLAAARPPARGFILGLPISVERTVELERRLTDDEWERLVVKLRETFNARGAMSAYGSFRQWTNGNLQALLEPTENGQRLRLRTVKGSAQRGIAAGLAVIGVSAAVALAGVLTGHPGMPVPEIALLSAFGVALLARGVVPLPRWARLRAQQMEAITAGLEAEQREKV